VTKYDLHYKENDSTRKQRNTAKCVKANENNLIKVKETEGGQISKRRNKLYGGDVASAVKHLSQPLVLKLGDSFIGVGEISAYIADLVCLGSVCRIRSSKKVAAAMSGVCYR